MGTFNSILLVLGNTEDKYAPLLKMGADLAIKNKGRLKIISVVEESRAAYSRELVRERIAWLEELAAGLERHGTDADSEVLAGTPFLEIIRAVLTGGHDLVLKNAEGKSRARRILFGSTDMHLFRKCPCPVWIKRPVVRGRISSIMAAVNPDHIDPEGKRLNHKIMEYAAGLARQMGARLHIVNAWSFLSEGLLRARSVLHQRDIDVLERETHLQHTERLQRLLDESGLEELEYEVHLLKGSAVDVIPELARKLKTGLIVMGTLGRTGIPGLLISNTAEIVLNRINSSVLAIKPEGFETPVSF